MCGVVRLDSEGGRQLSCAEQQSVALSAAGLQYTLYSTAALPHPASNQLDRRPTTFSFFQTEL